MPLADDSAGALWVGVDVGGTNIKAVVLAMRDGRLVNVDSRETPTEGTTPRDVLATVARIADTLHVAHPAVRGLGVSLPGAVNRLSGVTGVVPNLPGPWHGLCARDVLTDMTALPTVVLNDARAFTLAEALHGAGRGHRIVVGVTLGTGLGSGITVDGALLENETGMSGGDLGHQVVDRAGQPCPCGSQGCVETFASTLTLTHDAGRATVKATFDAAHQGDPRATGAIRAYIGNVALALANVHTLICPDLYVIGGGIASAGDRLLDPLRDALRAQVRFDEPSNVRLASAELGPFAGAVGAATMVASTPRSANLADPTTTRVRGNDDGNR